VEEIHGGQLYRERGKVRTNLQCTNCNKGFIAELDFRIDGDHVIECPYCRHEHLRRIRDGVVTEDRWGTREHRNRLMEIRGQKTWKHDQIEAHSSSASHFLAERWRDKL